MHSISADVEMLRNLSAARKLPSHRHHDEYKIPDEEDVLFESLTSTLRFMVMAINRSQVRSHLLNLLTRLTIAQSAQSRRII